MITPAVGSPEIAAEFRRSVGMQSQCDWDGNWVNLYIVNNDARAIKSCVAEMYMLYGYDMFGDRHERLVVEIE